MMKRYGITWPRVAFAAVLLLALIATFDATSTWLDGRDLADRAAEISVRLTKATTPQTDTNKQENNHQAQPTEQNTPATAAVDRIRKRHLFTPPPPEAFRNVQGVLGDRVLYPGGQSFTVGDNAMGATITAIGSNWVELEHDGQTIKLHIFGQGGNTPSVQDNMGIQIKERRDRRDKSGKRLGSSRPDRPDRPDRRPSKPRNNEQTTE